MPSTTHANIAHLLLISLAPAQLLAAQPEPQPEPDTRDAEQIERDDSTRLTLTPYAFASFNSDADFDSDNGEFGFSTYRAGLRLRQGIGDRGTLGANISFSLLDYDITAAPTATVNSAAAIGSGIDDVYETAIIVDYTHRGEGDFSYQFGAGVVSAGEDGADFGDTIDLLGTAGFLYRYSDKLSLGLGVLVKSRLEDDVLVVPVPQIRYQIDDRWLLETERAGVKLSYKSSESLTYGIAAEYIQETFRLNDSHTALASEGVVNHARVPVSIFAVYAPAEQIELRARIGASLASDIEFLDRNGNDITKEDIDTAIFGSINVSFRF